MNKLTSCERPMFGTCAPTSPCEYPATSGDNICHIFLHTYDLDRKKKSPPRTAEHLQQPQDGQDGPWTQDGQGHG